MNKFIIALISAVMIAATSSCSILRGNIETAKAEKMTDEKVKSEKPPSVRKPVVGEQVVARWGPGLWAEGRIDSFNATNKEAKILWADESSPSNVDVADIFPMPKSGDAISIKSGDYALVKSSNDDWWSGAEIREVGSVIKARVINGGEIVNLSREKVLVVTDTVAADIKDAADKQAFLDKAHEHTPARPDGYMPKAGDHILGAWTTNTWYGGKIKSVNGNKATVVWENGMSPDDAFLERVAPYPTASDPGPAPSIGDFVLVKPTNGNPKAAWLYARVTAVNGGAIEAKDIDETRQYKAGEYIRLER